MIRLLVIADDFTGGLDTGIKFSGRGIPTRVITDPQADFRAAAGDCEVLVVVAETRHVSAGEAYRTVFEVARNALSLGIPHLYKKTDSALRGNIGAELSALLNAGGSDMLPFLPALPALNRVTRNGIQYIDGVKVSDSVFGLDPFDPVKESDTVRMISLQSGSPVSLFTDSSIEQAKGIVVFDAETDEDLCRWGKMLAGAGRLTISAGCAGFASVLPELLDLHMGRLPCMPLLDEGMLVLCGSINPISRRQADMAEEAGFLHIRLRPEEKLSDKWAYSPEGRKQLAVWRRMLEQNPWMILDANDEDPLNRPTADLVRTLGLTTEETRQRISESLGAVFRGMVSCRKRRNLMIIGGDTLLRCMDQMGVSALEPRRELFPGVVLSGIALDRRNRYLITKSGGFGSETVLVDLQRIILDQCRCPE